jgi:hypothetical protein
MLEGVAKVKEKIDGKGADLQDNKHVSLCIQEKRVRKLIGVSVALCCVGSVVGCEQGDHHSETTSGVFPSSMALEYVLSTHRTCAFSVHRT